MAITWLIPIALILFILMTASFVYGDDGDGIINPVGILAGLFLMFILFYLFILSIKYNLADTVYVYRKENVKCYWIENQPFYKKDNGFYNLSSLVGKNIDLNTKSVDITYRSRDLDHYYYGFHPIDKNECAIKFEFNK